MIKSDKLFMNGNIITMEDGNPKSTTIATLNNKILYVGNANSVKEFINNDTKIFDLKGKTVLPGLNDNHVHFLETSKKILSVDLKECRSIEEIQKKLTEFKSRTKKGEWIRGVNFDQTIFKKDKYLPTRWDLDKVSTEQPIVIRRICAHVFVVNSLALKKFNITADMLVNKKEGIDLRTGEINGVFCEEDTKLIIKHIPNLLKTDKQKKEILKNGIQDAIKVGLTSIRPCDARSLDLEDPIQLYYELEKEGELPLRVCIDSADLNSLGCISGFGTDMVKYGAYKLFLDGSLGGRTAALSKPYSDMLDTSGVSVYTQKELNKLVREVYKRGLQIAMHAIGDKAIEMAITAMENILSTCEFRKNTRFRLIHASIMRDDLLRRLKKLPVVLDVQPILMRQSIMWAEKRLGKERVKHMYPFKTFIENGLRLAGGSDSPVEDMNPFWGIYFAVNRKNLDGYPKGGWYPEQKISVKEALELFTKNAAYASFEENLKGTLKTGKLADFVIIDRDIYKIQEDDIKNINVLATICNGKIVYNNGFLFNN